MILRIKESDPLILPLDFAGWFCPLVLPLDLVSSSADYAAPAVRDSAGALLA
jgi:hypothetical protein